MSPERRVRASLTVLFLINVLNYYDRQALGAVVEPLRHEFHLNDTQLGLLPTLFTFLYAVAGLPLGRLADTGSRKRLLAIGVSVWAGLTGLGAFASSYAMLLATRLGVGIGEAVCAPAATSWIGDLVPAKRRAKALAGFMMAVPVGVMLSLAISGPVAQAWGWRAALAIAAAPALLLVPILFRLDEPAHISGPGDASPLLLARIPALWWIAASGAIVNAVLYTFSYFMPAFLTRFHGVSVAHAGLWTGIGSGIAGILGAIGAAVFGYGRLRYAALATFLAVPPLFGAIVLPPGNAVAVVCLSMLAYGLLQTYYGLVYASLHDVVGPELRGTAISAYLLVSYLCGASFGPLLAGRLSDRFAREAAAAGAEAAKAIGLHQAMYVMPAMCLGLGAVLWMGARSAGKDAGNGATVAL